MKLRSSITGLALAVGLGVMVAGCGQVNQVRAQKAFKDANKLYAASDWRAAAAKYVDAFFQNIQWAIVSARLAGARAM